MKVKKKLIGKIATTAIAGLLVAAPFISYGVGNNVRNEMTAEARQTHLPTKWIDKIDDPCPHVNFSASGSRFITVCKVNYNDHPKPLHYYDHCFYNAYEVDHYAKIKNNAGRTKTKKAKCGKKASASITCHYKTGTSKIKAYWGIYDGYVDEFDSSAKLSEID